MVKKTRDDVSNHKSKMIKNFNKFLDDLIFEENEKSFLKADKISYWMEDWMNYLKLEESFECRRIPKLKRGSVVKVHLGFNIGKEEGGLHYAIVLDNNNALGHSLITIVPLTSV
ncbi:type II toxin-antitoxin system PemK/MazF family toxin, partial [Lactococcus lactis]